MAENEKAIRLRIAGRVQGVGFRDWTMRQADRLGLKGWVRNEPDGAVAALLSGPPRDVEEMLRRLHEGPPAASVSGVETLDAPVGEVPEGFHITG